MKKLCIGLLDYIGVLESYGLKRKPRNEIELLGEKIQELGYRVKVYPVDQCQIFFHYRTSEVLERNKKVQRCDVLIPRLDLASNTDLEVSILKQFQLSGIPVINGYMPTLQAKNKLRTMQILSHKGIPVPKTVVVRKFEYLDAAIEKVGGYPVILKSAFGSFGVGVVIVESRRSLYSALDLLNRNIETNMLMIQEYVAEADSTDYRAFVIGDKVVASMKRQAMKGEFRSNLHRGGEASKIILTAQEQTLAVKATKALGLQLAGVDILRAKDGPMVLEVNANPGFKGLMEVTGVDIPKLYIEYAVELAKKSSR